MLGPRVGRTRLAALGLSILGLGLWLPALAGGDEPAAEKEADPPARRPAGPGLGNFFQKMIQQMWQPQGGMAPRVRAGDGTTAERAAGARDAIDARAPRNPKLDGLWTAANTAVRQKDWKRGAELLQRILDSPEDAVYRVKGGRWESIRTAASRQLGQAPADVMIDYERQYGGLAEQLFQDAKHSGRIDALVEVATRFLHTAAGMKAANGLAHWHFDRAEFALAVRWFTELDAVKADVARDPRWRMKAAYAARQASPDQLKTFLNPVLADGNAAALHLGGQSVSASEGWSSLPSLAAQRTPVLQQWPQLFGSAARVGIASGNAPLLKPEWSIPLTANAALRRRFDWILQDLEDLQETPLMVGVPLVLGDKVAFRDLRGVRVVDGASGKTLWATTEGLSPERILTSRIRSEDGDIELPLGRGLPADFDDEHSGASAGLHPLVSHLFRDATIGLISADSRQLYVLEDVASLTRTQIGHQWDGDGEAVDPFGANWHSNRLSAYVLESGRRAWSIGGGEGRDPQEFLSGCFFLGAPVADGDELLVVGALGEEVRLLALDPATGLLKWSQLLAYADTKIDLDIARRWVSTPIAVGQGIVVCPTTVGWLVAVDRVRRSVLWAHRYVPEGEDHETGGEEGSMLLTPRDLSEQWLATPPVMTNSHVVFTPSDGDVIACLDLTQGRLQWQESREDGLYLAGVVDEHVVVVGQSSMISRRLSDGKIAWTHDWEEGITPNGRSAIVGDQIYVPLTDGSLRLIGLNTGEESQKLNVWPGEPALGSLVKAGRRLFAYGPQGLQMFDEQPGVLAEIQERKAVHPQDPEALIREAELWLLSPKYAEAARQLLAMDPAAIPAEWQQRRQVVLWQALVGIVQTDAAQADAALQDLDRIASTPDEQLSVELFRIDRQIQQGHREAAFEAYWKLAERDDGPAVVVRPSQPQLQVQRRAWLQGRLSDLWHSAEGELRQRLDERTRNEITQALDSPWERCLKLVQWCDFHPAAVQLHWKLSEEFAALRDFSRAEQHLLPWIESTDIEIAVESQWRLAQLCRQFGLVEDALVAERSLRSRFGSTKLSSGATIAEALAARPADATTVTPATPAAWGHDVLITQLVGTQYSPPVQEVPSPIQSPYLSQLLIQVEANEHRLTFADRRSGNWKWLAPLRGSPRAPDYGETPAAILGHSVIVLHKDVLQRLSPVDQRLVWSRTLAEHQDEGGFYHGANRSAPRALRTASLEDGDHEALFETASDGRLTAVLPGYVCLQSRRAITVYDPLTGQSRWTRTGISPHAMLFSARDFVCVMNVEDDSATVYRTSDGQPVEVPGLEPRLRRAIQWHGNDLIQLETQGGLRLFNLGNQRTVLRRTELQSGRDVWRQDFPAKTQIGMLDNEWAIAVDAPSGGRTSKRGVALIRMENGERKTLAPLALNATDVECFPLADAECVYLVANHGDGNTYHYGDSLTTLPVNGTVCCWDRSTGELLWTRDVADQNLVLERFAPSPVLLFLTRNWKQRGNASFTLLNILAVGKRSGQTLHESSTPSQFGGFHSLTLREHESTIELASYNQKLRLIPQRPHPSPTSAQSQQ